MLFQKKPKGTELNPFTRSELMVLVTWMEDVAPTHGTVSLKGGFI